MRGRDRPGGEGVAGDRGGDGGVLCAGGEGREGAGTAGTDPAGGKTRQTRQLSPGERHGGLRNACPSCHNPEPPPTGCTPQKGVFLTLGSRR